MKKKKEVGVHEYLAMLKKDGVSDANALQELAAIYPLSEDELAYLQYIMEGRPVNTSAVDNEIGKAVCLIIIMLGLAAMAIFIAYAGNVVLYLYNILAISFCLFAASIVGLIILLKRKRKHTRRLVNRFATTRSFRNNKSDKGRVSLESDSDTGLFHWEKVGISPFAFFLVLVPLLILFTFSDVRRYVNKTYLLHNSDWVKLSGKQLKADCRERAEGRGRGSKRYEYYELQCENDNEVYRWYSSDHLSCFAIGRLPMRDCKASEYIDIWLDAEGGHVMDIATKEGHMLMLDERNDVATYTIHNKLNMYAICYLAGLMAMVPFCVRSYRNSML
ncbi:hypothetical protein SAMN05421788_103186 [Filimonas lacunae]|uniref:Uncharacterized protein n=1 Tax=Filimonas lacunae TaxID=477680 RepID=A0A1N7P4H6_9BACT|nr:hypothetical protein [Filimonas lacunae]SIT05484.1 hypothetical protein SAMN05421788_103186 [Filimonas lacunae]